VKIFRYILFPISFLYGQIVRFRNKCYDKGIRTPTVFALPNIVVGNLNTGGTGKTPHVEYLVNLLQKNFKVAVLSRGYKRKTKGFLIADNKATARLIGDEPMQYHLKYRNLIVAVDRDRVRGLNKLKDLKSKPDVVILDDAFQHRRVKSKINILLTAYGDLYVDDKMLPTGNLRETPKNARRASHIIVTKCPLNLPLEEQLEIEEKLHLKSDQKLYFSAINYKDFILNNTAQKPLKELENRNIILVTGIANPHPLQTFLSEKNVNLEHLKYRDHHNFTQKDIHFISDKLAALNDEKALILTTEKDYVRNFIGVNKVFYLPIEVVFLRDANDFNNEIISYVEQSTRNS
jgi:tetraacyldisaccharide 4'-kinase